MYSNQAPGAVTENGAMIPVHEAVTEVEQPISKSEEQDILPSS